MPGVNFIPSQEAFKEAMQTSIRAPVVIKFRGQDSRGKLHSPSSNPTLIFSDMDSPIHQNLEYDAYSKDPRLGAIEFFESDARNIPDGYIKNIHCDLDEQNGKETFPCYVMYRHGVPEKLMVEENPFKLRGMFGLEIRD